MPIDPTVVELQQRALLAVVTALHEEFRIPETPVQFLGGCCRHLTRTGMMTALHDGLDPIGPEVIEVLIRYARETYGPGWLTADGGAPGGARAARVI